MTENTEYLEQEILVQYFENQATYAALWSTNPANAPDETNEISGGSYSPVQITSGGWIRQSTGGPTIDENDNVIDFGVLDSATDKSVEGVVYYDGSDTSTANALMYDDDISKTVAAGDEFRFPAGNATLEQD